MVQDTNRLEQIKDRIRKLFNVAKENSGAAEQEIETALKFAFDLMRKHHLEESDIVSTSTEEDAYERVRRAAKGVFYATASGKIYYWEAILGTALADICAVKCYRDVCHVRRAMRPSGLPYISPSLGGYSGRSIAFYGVAEDAAAAVELYYDLWETIRTMSSLKFGTIYRGDGGKYCEGFVVGIMRANQKVQEKLRQQSDQRGLILVNKQNELIAFKQQQAVIWYEQQGKGKLRKSKMAGAGGSHNAFFEGMKDGQQMNVDRQRAPKRESCS